MTQRDKRIEWESRYDAWKESGLSVAAWCREQSLKEHQMYYWIRKIEDRDAQPQQKEPPITSWMPVQLDYPIADGIDDGAVFIHFDSISVEVRPGTNMTVVSDVVNLLRKPC